MNKIFIIGDSFCNDFYWITPPDGIEKCFWVDDLKSKFTNYDFILSGQGSRDIQTILEIWIRIMKDLNENDIVIICLPYFRRTRLPLSEKNYLETKYGDITLYTRFTGTPNYDNRHDSLEFWGKENEWKFYLEKLQYQEVINTTYAYQKTTIEVIESLYFLTKSKKYIFSWDDMDVKSDVIEDKSVITNNVGFWETNQDDYHNTHGKCGQLGDLHWSHKMQKLFSNYIINKFNLKSEVKLI